MKTLPPELGSLNNGTFSRMGSVSSMSSKTSKDKDHDEPEKKQKEEEPFDIILFYDKTRIFVKKFMTTSLFGYLYDTSLLILSILSCLEFIYQTYLSDSPADMIINSNLTYVEMALAALFSFDWLLSFFMAEHKMSHFTSFYSMVDLLTVIPIWVTFNTVCPNYDDIYTAELGIIYILCGLGTTRVLRALRIRKKLILIEDEVDRCLGELSLTIVVMVLFSKFILFFNPLITSFFVSKNFFLHKTLFVLSSLHQQ